MRETIRVKGIFDDLFGSVTGTRINDEPFRDKDGTLILSVMRCTLDDGNVIELCLWTACGFSFWDISADKDGFDFHGCETFREYMKTKGLHACNVIEETDGAEWTYRGKIEKETQHRLQYCCRDKD